MRALLHFFLFPVLLRNPNFPYHSFKKKTNSTLQKMLISTMSTNESLPAIFLLPSSSSLLHSCLFFSLYFFSDCSLWHVGSFPHLGLNLGSLHWEGEVFTTGQPGKSLFIYVDFHFLWQRLSSLSLSSLGSLLIIKKC